MYYGYFDPTILLIIPAFILALYAQIRVSTMYKKYSKINTAKNITGAQLAQEILKQAGINDVTVQRSNRKGLSDNYNPKEHTVNLSSGVYDSTSVSALGIAAHECGHAIQHNVEYGPIKIHQSIIPAVKFGNIAALPLFFLGFIFALPQLIWIGIIGYSLTTLFYFVTLPVEFNASSRAIDILSSSHYLEGEELHGCKKVLNAAALTYVAAAAMSLLQLLRLILIGGRRR